MDDRERQFVIEYIANKGNAYQAALKAGYTKRTAKHAYEWLLSDTELNRTNRELPFKPYLLEEKERQLQEIMNPKIADATEVMEYLTSVIRKQSTSKMFVGCVKNEDGESEPVWTDKPSDEKEALKAAEIYAKILGISNEVKISGKSSVMIIDDIPKS